MVITRNAEILDADRPVIAQGQVRRLEVAMLNAMRVQDNNAVEERLSENDVKVNRHLDSFSPLLGREVIVCRQRDAVVACEHADVRQLAIVCEKAYELGSRHIARQARPDRCVMVQSLFKIRVPICDLDPGIPLAPFCLNKSKDLHEVRSEIFGDGE
jgi:hypothetical protein